MPWGEEDTPRAPLEARWINPTQVPWAALDAEREAHARTQGWLDRFQGAAAEATLEVDRLKAELADALTNGREMQRQRDRSQALVEQKREYIQTLLDEIDDLRNMARVPTPAEWEATARKRWAEAAEYQRTIRLLQGAVEIDDDDQDYVHESAQERYENEQRDGREV